MFYYQGYEIEYVIMNVIKLHVFQCRVYDGDNIVWPVMYNTIFKWIYQVVSCSLRVEKFDTKLPL